jgi:hypothetical protein
MADRKETKMVFKAVAIAALVLSASGCSGPEDLGRQPVGSALVCEHSAQGSLLRCTGPIRTENLDEEADEMRCESSGDGSVEICLCGDGGDCRKSGDTYYCGCDERD